MTEADFGRVLGAVLVRAFDEIRAATASMASVDKAHGKARGNDVNGRVHPRPSPRLLKGEIVELLEDGTWRTAAEIAEKGQGGMPAAGISR